MLAHRPAFALFPTWDGTRFDPSERGSAWFAADDVAIHGTARPSFGAVLDVADSPMEQPVFRSGSPVSTMVLAHVGASLVAVDRVRLGLSVPVQLYATGTEGVYVPSDTTLGASYDPPADEQAIGDARFSGDVRLYGEKEGPLRVGLGAFVMPHTATSASWLGSKNNVRYGARLVLAGDVRPFAWAAKVGVRWWSASIEERAFKFVPPVTTGDEIPFAFAAGVRAFDRRLLIGPEAFGSYTVGRALTGADLPEERRLALEVMLGAHLSLGSNVRIGAGLGRRLTSAWGTAALRGTFSLETTFDLVP